MRPGMNSDVRFVVDRAPKDRKVGEDSRTWVGSSLAKGPQDERASSHRRRNESP